MTSITSTIKKFNIHADCVGIKYTDKYSFYDFTLHPKTKIKLFETYKAELALALKESSVPKVNLLLDQGLVRLEFVKNTNTNFSTFNEIKKYPVVKNNKIPVILGYDMFNNPIWLDISQCPHAMIAGATGSGKSVALHNIVANILNYSSGKIIIFDPKQTEFVSYNMLQKRVSVFSSIKSIEFAIDSLYNEMENRFKDQRLLNFKHNPIVLIVDEFADILMLDTNKQIYKKICMLSQKSRSANIHLILATQRPSSSIIGGDIKANFPTRIAFKTSSAIDSKVILGSYGAERLSGKGEFIIKNYEHDGLIGKACYVTPKQVKEFNYGYKINSSSN